MPVPNYPRYLMGALSALELDCHGPLTMPVQLSRPSQLSARTRQVTATTPPSGTQRACEQLLRRSFQEGGQPACVEMGGRSYCPWATADDRSFPLVLARTWHGCGCRAVRQETAQPIPCLAANPQELSDFDVPVYVAGRLWCPAWGVFPASIRVGIVTTSMQWTRDPETRMLPDGQLGN
jgi:hypothetical protein